ncbi:MAG: hypothetical protein P8Y30_08085, partial [candidate division WOR-3 bacterium]
SLFLFIDFGNGGVLPKGLMRHRKCLCEFILLLDFCLHNEIVRSPGFFFYSTGRAISCDKVQSFNYKLFYVILFYSIGFGHHAYGTLD